MAARRIGRPVWQRFFSSTVHELHALNEQKYAKVTGWVQKSQKRGQVSFVHISDGLTTKVVQVVVPKTVCSSVPIGSGIEVHGSWTESAGSQQSMELVADQCTVVSTDSNARYSHLSPDHLRKTMHLRTRSPAFAALMRLRSNITAATHKYFLDRNYVHIDCPLLTANDCEGAGETFSVSAGASKDEDFFDREDVYLSVSGQLHLEAMTSGISRVYSLGPYLRAEKQQSSSHLSEFHMLEAELGFCQDLNVMCQLVENYLKEMCGSILNSTNSMENLKGLGKFSDENHSNMLESFTRISEFPRIPYSEAEKILREQNQKMTGNGLNKKNEAFLVEYFKSPMFVTHFPTSQKPFYMKRTEDDSLTESFDLLCPLVGELAGGSVRENCVELLKSRGKSIDWYLDCRARGKPSSAGFGVGFERLLQVLLGVTNIKDTIPFPRWYKHCQC